MAPVPPPLDAAAERAEAAEQKEKAVDTLPAAAADAAGASAAPFEGAAFLAALQKLRLERVHKSVFGSSHEPARVELTLAQVAFTGGAKPVKLQWGDVLGAHVLTASGERLAAPVDAQTVATKQHYLLGVFACPTRTHKPGTLKKRHLMEYFFRFKGDEMPAVVALQTYMNYLADPRSLATLEKAAGIVDISLEACRCLAPRKYLVLINPVGGAGACSLGCNVEKLVAETDRLTR